MIDAGEAGEAKIRVEGEDSWAALGGGEAGGGDAGGDAGAEGADSGAGEREGQPNQAEPPAPRLHQRLLHQEALQLTVPAIANCSREELKQKQSLRIESSQVNIGSSQVDS